VGGRGKRAGHAVRMVCGAMVFREGDEGCRLPLHQQS
jgi:hypothetical protein